jgi:hypothetical protein
LIFTPVKERSVEGDGGSLLRGPGGEGRPRFPELPIINPGELPAAPAAPPRGQREKYGSLFYLGIAGLVVLVALIGWFGHGLWTNRDIWADVYVLNDASRPEADRLDAALQLARNPRLDDAPRMEMALRKDLPALARYLLAESVSTEQVAHDPRSYALAVARSEGWPDWLRLLLSRRLAYGAGRGYDIPREALDELKGHTDPMIGLWATYSLAVLPHGDPDPRPTAELENAAQGQGPTAELAARLLGALRAAGDERELRLDEATEWLRRHHPEAAEIWRGRGILDQRVVPRSVQ